MNRFGTTPNLMRSSGTWAIPVAFIRRPELPPIPVPSILIEPLSMGRSPVIASISSFCPLPETPAIPKISFWCIERETCRTAKSPRSPLTAMFLTSITAAPLFIAFLWRLKRISRPTIIRARAGLSTCSVTVSPTTSPFLSTTTRSQMPRISSSLWLIKITECLSWAILRRIVKSSSDSWGVSTLVGSSRIRRSAPWKRAFTISTFCCSPAESCQIFTLGSTLRPYRFENSSSFCCTCLTGCKKGASS